MKTKQINLRAVFTAEVCNAVNMADKKQLLSRYVIVDKKTEARVVDCRVYGSGSTVWASIWVYVKNTKRPGAWQYGDISGHGKAGGHGYCKESKAIEQAITSCGIELYGTPYNTQGNFKQRAWIGGTGCHESALKAIAYAAGFNDCIVVGG